MAKKRSESLDAISMDMTPMIDVVFLLIIFFMIVIDLSQKELEDIVLPRANQCDPDRPDDPEIKNRKIVNLRQDGDIVVMRQEMDLVALENNLLAWKNSGLFKNEATGHCSKPILIRTDRGTEMKHCQKVMQICGKENLKIWKIELACKQDAAGLQTVEDPMVIPDIPDDDG